MVLTLISFVVILVLAAVLRSSPRSLEVDYHSLPRLGDKDAPVHIVEFGDYKCPVCKSFVETIKPRLIKDYVETGKVALYFMNYWFIGPDSYTAALAAQSVYHQNQSEFWKYYSAIYKHQGEKSVPWATPEFLMQLAKNEQLAIDHDMLNHDIRNKTYAKEIDTHQAFARDTAKASGTPTLLINGTLFTDVFDYDKLKAAIEAAQREGRS